MYCVSCGEQKRLRFPPLPVAFPDQGRSCTQRCAAEAFHEYLSAGPWEGAYCTDCGELGEHNCGLEVEE